MIEPIWHAPPKEIDHNGNHIWDTCDGAKIYAKRVPVVRYTDHMTSQIIAHGQPDEWYVNRWVEDFRDAGNFQVVRCTDTVSKMVRRLVTMPLWPDFAVKPEIQNRQRFSQVAVWDGVVCYLDESGWEVIRPHPKQIVKCKSQRTCKAWVTRLLREAR